VAGLGHSLGTSYTYAHPLGAEQTQSTHLHTWFHHLSKIGEPLVYCIELHHLVALGGSFGLVVSLLLLVFADT
jgi:hypothetical protein